MKTYLVGGCVRDRLMGHAPKDIDYVVVGATPEEMLAKGFKQVGADFPVFLSPGGEEFALARTERKSGRGYNGFVTDHSPNITVEEDLARRDLTINAMAVGPIEGLRAWESPALVDPFNGREDLKNKVLRHVSEAFADDPVRVLRLARFHARYGSEWTVAPETMEFCREMVKNGELAFLTKERVLKEMEKALSESEPHLFFETLRECGALEVVFPEVASAEASMVHWALFNFRSRSARFNYAKLSSQLAFPEALEKRLNVSTAFKSFAKMFREATKTLDIHPVDRLYNMDAFRNTALCEEMLQEALGAGFTGVKFVKEAFQKTRHVNFESLPPALVETLKGREITEAIRQARRLAFEENNVVQL